MDNITTVIGLVAATLTTFAYLPQSWKMIKTRQTKDLSLNMVVMLELGFTGWLLYGIFLDSLPIIAANTLSLILMSVILILKLKHK